MIIKVSNFIENPTKYEFRAVMFLYEKILCDRNSSPNCWDVWQNWKWSKYAEQYWELPFNHTFITKSLVTDLHFSLTSLSNVSTGIVCKNRCSQKYDCLSLMNKWNDNFLEISQIILYEIVAKRSWLTSKLHCGCKKYLTTPIKIRGWNPLRTFWVRIMLKEQTPQTY